MHQLLNLKAVEFAKYWAWLLYDASLSPVPLEADLGACGD